MKIDKVVTGYLEGNCYILTIDNESLIIDPGDDYHLIKEKLGKNKVIGILLTHSHFDHTGAVEKILEDYNTQVYAFDNLSEGSFKIKNFTFEVVYTPGHTADSISFYFEQEKIMFTGDFLFKESIGRCDLPTGSIDQMKKSLNKINKYSNDVIIYPGHGDETTLLYERSNNQYLFTK
ncbi:MAG: MBL fold metallo-hydrolase [Bacilli bacterium]|nr:MBL fold metallo-hydrolase [Bacilli bacterium]